MQYNTKSNKSIHSILNYLSSFIKKFIILNHRFSDLWELLFMFIIDLIYSKLPSDKFLNYLCKHVFYVILACFVP